MICGEALRWEQQVRGIPDHQRDHVVPPCLAEHLGEDAVAVGLELLGQGVELPVGVLAIGRSRRAAWSRTNAHEGPLPDAGRDQPGLGESPVGARRRQVVDAGQLGKRPRGRQLVVRRQLSRGNGSGDDVDDLAGDGRSSVPLYVRQFRLCRTLTIDSMWRIVAASDRLYDNTAHCV